MSVLIYKIDSSKLVPIGQPGYQKGQEQARIYFDEVPKGEFTVAITDAEHIKRIASLASVDLRGNNRILVDVNNEDLEHVGLTIYYFDVSAGRAHHRIVSYANCDAESNYPLANEILEYIEETVAQKRAQMSVNNSNIVTIIYDLKAHRAQADDGVHGKAWVDFPNHLMLYDGQQYVVDALYWTGTKYTVSGNIKPMSNVKDDPRIDGWIAHRQVSNAILGYVEGTVDWEQEQKSVDNLLEYATSRARMINPNGKIAALDYEQEC